MKSLLQAFVLFLLCTAFGKGGYGYSCRPTDPWFISSLKLDIFPKGAKLPHGLNIRYVSPGKMIPSYSEKGVLILLGIQASGQTFPLQRIKGNTIWTDYDERKDIWQTKQQNKETVHLPYYGKPIFYHVPNSGIRPTNPNIPKPITFKFGYLLVQDHTKLNTCEKSGHCYFTGEKHQINIIKASIVFSKNPKYDLEQAQKLTKECAARQKAFEEDGLSIH